MGNGIVNELTRPAVDTPVEISTWEALELRSGMMNRSKAGLEDGHRLGTLPCTV
jgi:hypothetical protein